MCGYFSGMGFYFSGYCPDIVNKFYLPAIGVLFTRVSERNQVLHKCCEGELLPEVNHDKSALLGLFILFTSLFLC